MVHKANEKYPPKTFLNVFDDVAGYEPQKMDTFGNLNRRLTKSQKRPTQQLKNIQTKNIQRGGRHRRPF